MQVDHIIKLTPSHPIGHYDNQWHITEFHIVGSLIEISLLKPKMVLLAIQIAFCGEVCHAFIIDVVADFPLFSFAEFVDNADDGTVAVWGEIFFADLSEDPAPRTILTIDKLINLDLIIIEINIVRVMLGNKVSKVNFQLISNNYVSISEQ